MDEFALQVRSRLLMDKLTALHTRTPYVLNNVITNSPHYVNVPVEKSGADVMDIRNEPKHELIGKSPGRYASSSGRGRSRFTPSLGLAPGTGC